MTPHLTRILGSVALLAGSPTLAGPSTPEAAACHGQPATLVGSPGASLVGTDDADVIDTAGANGVDALAGDDLICVTQGGAAVAAGPGDDVVDTTETPATATSRISLGPGADELLGGPGRQFVSAAAETSVDPDRDLIDTGGGRDTVYLRHGEAPSEDAVDLGGSRDRLVLAGENPGVRIDGGAGADHLVYFAFSEHGDWVVDTRAEEMTRDGRGLARVSGFTGFEMNLGGGSLTFIGSAAPETLRATPLGPLRVAARMGAGPDVVRDFHALGGSRFQGGRGRDRLESHGPLLDLSRGRLVASLRTPPQRVPGFEDAYLSGFGSVTVIGTPGPNRLIARARKKVRLVGHGGRDELAVLESPKTSEVRGGAGNDVLTGAERRDVLVGGPGHDLAAGGRGHDLCRAEVRRDCEAG